jgi:hypothetical protein
MNYDYCMERDPKLIDRLAKAMLADKYFNIPLPCRHVRPVSSSLLARRHPRTAVSKRRSRIDKS